MAGQELPVLPDSLDSKELVRVWQEIRAAHSRGELGTILAREVSRFSMFDLQVIGGAMREEIRKLPSPYRERVGGYLMDQIFGVHHRLLQNLWNSEFTHLTSPVRDADLFQKFCNMVPLGCLPAESGSGRCLPHYRPRYRLFYYLIACYVMFVEESPGHPVGMPFPGPLRVENRDGIFLCPVRDKEKEVEYSICNFCPARQSEPV